MASGNASDSGQAVPSPFKSEIITIVVGSESGSGTYTAHRELLCAASPFFQKCLSNPLKEGTSRVVNLPEDVPEVFEEILRWVYFKSTSKAVSGDTVALRRMIQVYLLADRLCMETMFNELMDAVRRWHAISICCYTALLDANGNQLPDCQMRQFLTEELAQDLAVAGYQTVSGHHGQMTLAEFLPQVPDVAAETIRLTGGYRRSDGERRSKCAYHVHVSTTACELLENNGDGENRDETRSTKRLRRS